jgi:hypothetical protein
MTGYWHRDVNRPREILRFAQDDTSISAGHQLGTSAVFRYWRPVRRWRLANASQSRWEVGSRVAENGVLIADG